MTREPTDEEIQFIEALAVSSDEAIEALAEWLSPSQEEALQAFEEFLHKEYKEKEALALFMDMLESLKSNPTMAAAPVMSRFVNKLHSDLSKQLDALHVDAPETLASVREPEIAAETRKKGATKAASARHRGTQKVRARIQAAMEEMSDNLSKNQKAKKVAPLALKWNEEADRPFTWRTEEQAEAYARAMLKPSKKRGDMRA